MAKRLRAEKVSEELSRILRKLSDKGLKYAVKVSAGEEQAREETISTRSRVLQETIGSR